MGSMCDDKVKGDPGLSAIPRGGGVAESARGLLGPDGEGDPAGEDASADGLVSDPKKLRTFSSSDGVLASTSLSSDDRKVGAPACDEKPAGCCAADVDAVTAVAGAGGTGGPVLAVDDDSPFWRDKDASPD